VLGWGDIQALGGDDMAQVFGNDWADRRSGSSRWGHSGPTIFVVVIGAMALLTVLPVAYPPGGKPLISLAFIAVMFTTYFEMRKHDRGLCERCVAEFPLNPAQDAETYSRRLATVHLLAEKRAAAWYLAAILVACLLPILAPAPLRTPALVLWLASLASLAYILQSGVTHRRLQPWCPQCGNQGGNDKVDTPEPMPLDSMS
jgi:hypothetical protein